MSYKIMAIPPPFARLALFFVIPFLLIQSASAQEEFVVNAREVTKFQFEGNSLGVWASTRNDVVLKERPNQWQFRYQPVFLPERKSDGTLNINKGILTGTKWQVQLPIVLYNEQIQREAYQAILKAFPEHKDEIRLNNVAAITVYNLSFDISLLKEIDGARMESNFGLIGTPGRVLLNIVVPDEATANQVAELLPRIVISYRMSFVAATRSENALKIKFSDLKSSNLFAKLNGVTPTQEKEVYINRDDLRKLTEGISSQLEVGGTIENPEKFDFALFERIINVMTQAQDVLNENNAFSKEQWAATYNADDLKPDVIEKDLNKVFKKNNDEYQLKTDQNIDIKTKAKVMAFFDGTTDVSHGFKKDELQKKLSEHNIETDLEGEQIRVRSIKLRRLNLSEFNRETQFTQIMAFIGVLKETRDGSIFMSQDLNGRKDFPNIESRIGILENLKFSMMPIGSIIAYAGPVENLEIETDGRWMVCDGRLLDKAGKYSDLSAALKNSWGESGSDFRLPDLRGYFLRGVDSGANIDTDANQRTDRAGTGVLGSIVGSYEADATKIPSKPFITSQDGAFDPANKGYDRMLKFTRTDTVANVDNGLVGEEPRLYDSKPILPIPSHHHTIETGGDSETRPKNAGVHWLIRVM